MWPGARRARVLYKNVRRIRDEALWQDAAQLGKWFDTEMCCSMAKTKKETGGLAEGPSNNWLAEQQRIANQLTLHQVRYRPVGYLMLTISKWVPTCGLPTVSMGLAGQSAGMPMR